MEVRRRRYAHDSEERTQRNGDPISELRRHVARIEREVRQFGLYEDVGEQAETLLARNQIDAVIGDL